MGQRTEIGAGTIPPGVGECLATNAANVDAVVSAGDGIEPSGVDDHIELMMLGCGLDSGFSDAFDRRVGQRDQVHIVSVICLEVPSLKRQSLHGEPMILRDQLLGDLGIVDPVADAVGDVLRHLLVGLLVEKDLREVCGRDGETGFRIELVPGLDAFLGGQVPEASAVGHMFEAAG